jgi:4-amino-4-deoxy-L-arabinose transferase-like glycosyltransferase
MNRLPERWHPLLLLGLCAALYFTHLAGTDLKEPNEPTSAQAAREMVDRRDWIFPTVNREPYPDKPPLLFWAIALASAPFGEVNEIGARLPSACAATLCVLSLYFLTRRTLESRGALFAAATLAVSTFFVEQARYVQHDMLLCLGATVSILALFRLRDGEEPRAGWTALAVAGVAVGVLAKGPIGLVLPALILGASALAERRLFQGLGRMAAAAALGMVPVLLYYLALARRGGWEILETFLFRHNMNRFVAGFDHEQPWWYFLLHSPVDLLPGTLLLPAAAFLAPADPARRSLHRRCWIWILVPLVFFSLSASKRPVYMLPALPPIALLCGSLVEAVSRGRAARLVRWLAFAGAGLSLGVLGLAGVAAPFLAWRRAPSLLVPAGIAALVAAAGAGFGLTRLRRGGLSIAWGTLLASLFALWLVAVVGLLPAANPINSPRPFAQEILRQVPPEAPLMTYGLYRFRCGYIFYAGRPMPRLADLAALRDFLSRPERVFCILPQEDYDRLDPALKEPAHVLARGGAGRRRDVLISNQPSAPSGSAAPGSPGTARAFPPPGARTESGS